MDSEEAIAYLNSMHAEGAPQTSEATPSEGPAATAEQPVEQKTAEPVTEVEPVRETGEVEVPEKKAEEVPPAKKKPSRQEQINHAFQRTKQRHKAEIEARDKRIAELEEKVKKYSVLEQGDFDPNDVKSYIDHKFALNGEQAELDRLKSERDRQIADDRQAEASERHARQVEQCFGTDEEREHYWNLLKNGGQKFRDFLSEYDDGTIDQFIGDSDMAPALISTLMRNPEILRSIVEKRNPMRKAIVLQQLENRISIARKVGQARTDKGAPQTKPKPTLPITGSAVQNPGTSAESTAHDWNRYLQEHPHGA